jgi:galactonate dehydratase
MQVNLATPNFIIQEMSLGIHYNTADGGQDALYGYIKDSSVWDIKEGGFVYAPRLNEEEVWKVAPVTQPWESIGFFGINGEIREW